MHLVNIMCAHGTVKAKGEQKEFSKKWSYAVLSKIQILSLILGFLNSKFA